MLVISDKIRFDFRGNFWEDSSFKFSSRSHYLQIIFIFFSSLIFNMTRTDTNVARRKLRSSRASRGQNNKRKHNKPSKAVRRRHFRRKGIDKPQESEGLAQQALGVAAFLFMEKKELEKKVVHKEDEIGHLKETEDQNRLL